MKGTIIFRNRTGDETAFKITNEHLMEEMFHKIAFLAESGRGVSYIKEEDYKDFRRAVNRLFIPGGLTNFYGVIGDDGIRKEAVQVKFEKTLTDNIEEYTVKINRDVLKHLDREVKNNG